MGTRGGFAGTALVLINSAERPSGGSSSSRLMALMPCTSCASSCGICAFTLSTWDAALSVSSPVTRPLSCPDAGDAEDFLIDPEVVFGDTDQSLRATQVDVIAREFGQG